MPRVSFYAKMSYLEPALPLLLLLALISVAQAWQTSAKGRRPVLLTISIVGILLLSTNLFAWLLSLPLEVWYDDRDTTPRATPEAIVVLSGSVNQPLPDRPYSYVSQDTYRRLQHGIWLFRHWNSSVPILVCGGGYGQEPYSQTMRRVLESEGVPPNLIWTEGVSRNTHEDALYGSEVLRGHDVSLIALVVEANSMPRAAASFQKVGIRVLPAPIRFTKLNLKLSDVFPSWQAIALNGESVHELVGLLWYRLRGWV